jgi:hypothetical protein
VVIFSSVDDWANTGCWFAESLKSIGIEATAVSYDRHRFSYPIQAKNVHRYTGNKIVDIFVYMHSYDMNKYFNSKHKLVFHGGTRYRRNPRVANNIFNHRVDASMIQTLDLMGLGAKNEIWVIPPVPSNLIKPDFTEGNKLRISHFPTSPEKGTAAITKIIDNFSSKHLEYHMNKKTVSWENNLGRMRESDIYVESLKKRVEDRNNWGMSAIEASLLGKIVITNFIDKDKYEQKFGKFGPLTANDETELRNTIDYLLSCSKTERKMLRERCYEWAVKTHGLEATGKRFEEEVINGACK